MPLSACNQPPLLYKPCLKPKPAVTAGPGVRVNNYRCLKPRRRVRRNKVRPVWSTVMAKKLKVLINKLEDVDEKYRDLYIANPAGAGFVLEEIDEKDYRGKIDEFRTSNIALKVEKEKLEALATVNKDIDPQKYKEALSALEQLEKIEDSQLIKEGKWDEVIKKRTGAMQNSYELEKKALQEAKAKAEADAARYKTGLSELKIETAITKAVTSVGQPRKGAITHIINKARAQWVVDDEGNLKSKDLFNEKGDPMGLDEYGKFVMKEDPYLFEPAQGGGAPGGNRTGGGKPQQGTAIIEDGDPVAFGKNLEALATGKAVVSGTIPTS